MIDQHDDKSDSSGSRIQLAQKELELRDLSEWQRATLESSRRIAQANELSSQVIGAVAQGILCLTPEQPYRIRLANPCAAGLLSTSEASLQGRNLKDVLEITADNIQSPEGRIENLKLSESTAFEATVRSLSNPVGFPATLTIARAVSGEEEMLVLTIQDMTHRRQTEQSLKLSSKVFEVSSESIMITDAAGKIISVNPAFTWLTGFRPDEAIGHNPRILKSGQHDDAFYSAMWTNLKSRGQWRGEIWDKRKDGSIYPKWVNIDAVRENGEITHYVAISHDISQHKQHEARIQHLAEHDALTGLPNRRVLAERTSAFIGSQRQQDQNFALILIDLDRFKNINDSLGHLIGDKVLIETSRRLIQSVRNTDNVIRLGGDEFVVLLTNIENPLYISEIASNIQEQLSKSIHLEERSLHTPPSIGIACYPKDGKNIDELLRNADAAMYLSKSRGGNTWTFYTKEINERLSERLMLEESLHEAISKNSLQLYFQPLFNAQTKQIASWEALLRWDHPTLGPIPPDRIIPIAEETGLIHAIGEWVINTACKQVREWKDNGRGEFRISINVSPTQLDLPGFSNIVLNAITTARINPCQIELEITESVLISHSTAARESLLTLRENGILLTLDDFGTGYSSLTYLKSLSIDRIKIDRSFISNVLENKQDAQLFRLCLC